MTLVLSISSLGSLVLFHLQMCGLHMMPDLAQFSVSVTNCSGTEITKENRFSVDETGGACSMCGRGEKYIQHFAQET